MRKLALIIFLIICLGDTGWIKAQQILDYYSHLNEEKWFPRQTIRCIYQDSKGYLWVATNAGLFSYNNYQLKNFDISKNLQTDFLSNTINSLSEDIDGNLLVATESGLGVINLSENKKMVLTKSDETIPKVLRTKDGAIWFYDNNYQLFQITTKNYRSKKLNVFLNLKKASGVKNIQIRQMYLSPQGTIFFATNVGLYKVDKIHKSVIKCFNGYEILKVFETLDGKLLVVRNGDLLSLKKKNNTDQYELDSILIKGERIRLLNGESNGVIIATSQNKVFACLTDGGKLDFHPLVDDFLRLYNITIKEASIDRNHNIWLGTQKGLYKINKQKIKIQFFNKFTEQTKDGNLVNDLFYHKSKLWICSSKEGLFTLDPKRDQLNKQPIPINNAMFIRNTSEGNLMLLANHKLIEFNEASPSQFSLVKLPYLPNHITDMIEAAPKEWWFLSWNSGISRYVKPNNKGSDSLFFKEVADSLKKAHLFGMIKSTKGQIWVVSRGGGAFKIDLKKQKIYHYQERGKYAIPSNRLMCIFEDHKGQIWIGTRGNGLLKYNPKEDKFDIFSTKDGLPSNTICDIIENSTGNLWVSTLDGIAKYQPKELLAFYPYGIDDGIFNPEFSFTVGSAGLNNTMYFGTSNGFYKISYLKKSDHSKPIPVVWTDFKVLNQDDKQDSTISFQLLNSSKGKQKVTLTSDQNSFTVGFAALDFTIPSKTQYAYRLVGYDDKWNFIAGEEAFAQYLDIPSGDYTFEVRVTNERGEWTVNPRLLHIMIMPSFWVTKTAVILYLLVLISLVSFGWVLLKRWYKLNKDLNSELAVSELHNQQMIQFADLSHEIKNRLTLILGPLENALKGKRVNQTILNNLYEQAQRLKRLSDQIIKIRKSESGAYVLNVSEEQIKQHLNQVFYEMEPLALVKNVKLDLHLPQEELYGWYDKELLEIIVLNVLGNAIKYSQVNGHVDMNVEQLLDEESLINWLVIKIIDDGIGIPKEDISKIMDLFYRASNTKKAAFESNGDGIGLNLVSRLIKIHHGRLLIESIPNIKTEFEIRIPISKSEYHISELKMNVKNTQIIISEADVSENLIIQPSVKLSEDINIAGKSILIVDDEIEIINLLTEGLKGTFKIKSAKNGRLALELLNSQSFDLVISDLSMPEMDGLSLCAHIRNNSPLAHLPFILLTARNSDEQKLIAFKSQVDDFIEKPFSLELIKWRVKALLRQRESLTQNIQKVVIPDQEIDYSDSPDEIFLQKVVNIIDSNLANEFLNVDFLADEMNMSRATFYRKMETLFGESPSQYIKKFRLKKAVAFLKLEKYTISEIAFKTGFKTANYFSKCFHKEFGKSPTEFLESQ